MLQLAELIEHRDALDSLNKRSRVTGEEEQALEVVTLMLSALITQLDSQSISFTP